MGVFHCILDLGWHSLADERLWLGTHIPILLKSNLA